MVSIHGPLGYEPNTLTTAPLRSLGSSGGVAPASIFTGREISRAGHIALTKGIALHGQLVLGKQGACCQGAATMWLQGGGCQTACAPNGAILHQPQRRPGHRTARKAESVRNHCQIAKNSSCQAICKLQAVSLPAPAAQRRGPPPKPARDIQCRLTDITPPSQRRDAERRLTYFNGSCGLMDKAPPSQGGDCGFESHLEYFPILIPAEASILHHASNCKCAEGR